MRAKKLHSKNILERPHRRKPLLIGVAVLALGILVVLGLVAGHELRDLWLEQCILTDIAEQVEVTSGKMVKPDAIREAFDLHAGQNLAQIDFAERRHAVLQKYPTIRSIDITRRLPRRVIIRVTEREPFARMSIKGQRPNSGRVTDAEGMVFPCRRGVDMLPLIKEGAAPGTPIGKRLQGNALAALELIRAALDPEFQELGLLEVDTSAPDHLLATFGNANRAKIAWEGMNEVSRESRRNLTHVLRNLRDAMRTNLTPPNIMWNATEPNKIYANTKEKIQ